MLALSVSISTISSPRDTSSPSDLSHLRIVPSSMESDRRGIATSAMCRNVQIRPLQLPPADRTAARGRARRAGRSSRRISAQRPVGDDAPAGQDHRALAQLGGERQVVGHDEHRLLEPRERLQQLAPRARVEVGRRLVEHQQRAGPSPARSRSRRGGAARARAGAARGRRRAPSARRPAPGSRPATSGADMPRFSGPNATSSRTVGMNSWSSGSWNTSPTRARSSRTSSRPTSMPATSSSPEPGSSPFRWSISVVLPAPFGPEHGDALAVPDVQVDAVERRRRRWGSGSAARARGSRSSSPSPDQDAQRQQALRATARNSASARANASASQPRHRAGVAAGEHRQVDALAAVVGAQEQRGGDAADAPPPAARAAGA